jgi:hypothetical protein
MSMLRRLPPWLLLVLCVLYVLSPVDLLPDVLGLPGRFDDLLVALGTLYYLYTHSKKIPGAGRSRRAGAANEGRRGQEERREYKDSSSGRAAREPYDPYSVLEVNRGEDLEGIRSRYKEKLLQYHPDRVQHLGKEFQDMAELRTKEITEAYQRILRERGG